MGERVGGSRAGRALVVSLFIYFYNVPPIVRNFLLRCVISTVPVR